MSKKKRSGTQHGAPTKKNSTPPPVAKKQSARNTKSLWVVGVIVAIFVVIAVAGYGGKGTSGAEKAAGVVPAEEAKYIGRFLPDGYESPNVGGGIFSGAKKMSPITATQTEAALEVSVRDVKQNRIVSFEYAKSDSEKVPMIAYVRPSGKLFVGVSYCVPCRGTGQDIGSDGTLTCQSCGTKRDLESSVGISGACRLYPLDEMPVTVEGDKIVIEKAALDGWTVQPTDRPVG